MAVHGGRRAFDEYREKTLRRLEEEQEPVKALLVRPRQAKYKAKFEQFTAERGRRTCSGPDAGEGAVVSERPAANLSHCSTGARFKRANDDNRQAKTNQHANRVDHRIEQRGVTTRHETLQALQGNAQHDNRACARNTSPPIGRADAKGDHQHRIRDYMTPFVTHLDIWQVLAWRQAQVNDKRHADAKRRVREPSD